MFARIAVVLGLCLVTTAYPARAGKYWICNHPSHRTKNQDRLQSQCMPSNQAVEEAEAHRKIHPNDVVVFTCVM